MKTSLADQANALIALGLLDNVFIPVAVDTCMLARQERTIKAKVKQQTVDLNNTGSVSVEVSMDVAGFKFHAEAPDLHLALQGLFKTLRLYQDEVARVASALSSLYMEDP